MQYVVLLEGSVVDILSRERYDKLDIEVDTNNLIITKGEFEGCELYEDEEHKFHEGLIRGKELILLHREYRAQTEAWKREWLKNNPPTETVHHLTNPVENTKRRFDEWSRYVTYRAEKWWGERGWKIIWGSPHEGCRFEKLPR
jgi:hypothetical protein